MLLGHLSKFILKPSKMCGNIYFKCATDVIKCTLFHKGSPELKVQDPKCILRSAQQCWVGVH